MKTAILLVNIGTPKNASPHEVGKFLFRFLNDKRVITLPFLARALLVNLIIIPFCLRKSVKRYKAFFDSKSSSLTDISTDVVEKLNSQLPKNYKAFAAMQYSVPLLQDVVKQVIHENFEKIILLPLYPQYAEATSGSAIARAKQIISRLKVQPKLQIIEGFHNHPAYINALAKTLSQYQTETYDHILFSYHSLPLSQTAQVKNTQYCYKTACYTTSDSLAQKLGLSTSQYSTSFQSSISPRWLGPLTNNELIRLAHEGKSVLLLSPGLVADCLETSHELAIESAELFCKHGGKKLQVVPSLNSTPAWIEAIRTLTGSQSPVRV